VRGAEKGEDHLPHRLFVLAHAGDRRPTPASGLLPTDADGVIVRTGSYWGVDNQTWLAIFRDITDQLAAGTAAAGSASDATAGSDHSRTPRWRNERASPLRCLKRQLETMPARRPCARGRPQPRTKAEAKPVAARTPPFRL
jgi:hypothetical protein